VFSFGSPLGVDVKQIEGLGNVLIRQRPPFGVTKSLGFKLQNRPSAGKPKDKAVSLPPLKIAPRKTKDGLVGSLLQCPIKSL
jgi:hypothetical protein